MNQKLLKANNDIAQELLAAADRCRNTSAASAGELVGRKARTLLDPVALAASVISFCYRNVRFTDGQTGCTGEDVEAAARVQIARIVRGDDGALLEALAAQVVVLQAVSAKVLLEMESANSPKIKEQLRRQWLQMQEVQIRIAATLASLQSAVR